MWRPMSSILKIQKAVTNCFHPVKQKRALLKSNPPRDNWMRRRNKNVSRFWGGQKPPQKEQGRPLFQSLPCLENLDSNEVQTYTRNNKIPKALSTVSGKVQTLALFHFLPVNPLQSLGEMRVAFENKGLFLGCFWETSRQGAVREPSGRT